MILKKLNRTYITKKVNKTEFQNEQKSTNAAQSIISMRSSEDFQSKFKLNNFKQSSKLKMSNTDRFIAWNNRAPKKYVWQERRVIGNWLKKFIRIYFKLRFRMSSMLKKKIVFFFKFKFKFIRIINNDKLTRIYTKIFMWTMKNLYNYIKTRNFKSQLQFMQWAKNMHWIKKHKKRFFSPFSRKLLWRRRKHGHLPYFWKSLFYKTASFKLTYIKRFIRVKYYKIKSKIKKFHPVKIKLKIRALIDFPKYKLSKLNYQYFFILNKLVRKNKKLLYDLKYRFSNLSNFYKSIVVQKFFIKYNFPFSRFVRARLKKIKKKLNILRIKTSHLKIPQLNIKSKIETYFFKNWRNRVITVNLTKRLLNWSKLNTVLWNFKNYFLRTGVKTIFAKHMNCFFSKKQILPQKYYLYLILSKKFRLNNNTKHLKWTLNGSNYKFFKKKFIVKKLKKKKIMFFRNFRYLQNLAKRSIQLVTQQRNIINDFFYTINRDCRLNNKFIHFKNIRTWDLTIYNEFTLTLNSVCMMCKLFFNKIEVNWFSQNNLIYVNNLPCTRGAYILGSGDLVQITYNKNYLYFYYRQRLYWKKRYLKLRRLYWIKQKFFTKKSKSNKLYLYRRTSEIFEILKTITKSIEIDFSTFSLFVIFKPIYDIDSIFVNLKYLKFQTSKMYNWRFFY